MMEKVKSVIASENIKFIRLECDDMNGVSRGLVLDADVFVERCEEGFGMYDPAYLFTTNGEMIQGPGVAEQLDIFNSFMYPDLETFRKLPWTENEASVLVDYHLKSGDRTSKVSDVSARQACKKQLEKLSELGITFYGAFEYEFYLLEPNSKRSLCNESNFVSIQTAMKEKKLIYDTMTYLKAMDIFPETFRAEYGPAQHEITMCPEFGLKVADNASRFKHVVKEVSENRDYLATFMSKPFPKVSGSSGHFNHSLWSTDGKNNLFYDPNRPHGLSELCEHWIAGLRLHAKGLMALVNPTPNCYERTHPGTFAPVNNTWGIDNRTCAFRIKNYDASQTYVENRIGGAAGNSYMVMAATIIAGLDGVKKELKLDVPPYKGDAGKLEDTSGTPLPTNLNEALECLAADEVFKEELGDEFIKWFTILKRFENERAGGPGCQREYYAKYI